MQTLIRFCILTVALCLSSSLYAQDRDCSGSPVTFGEVMAGLQAGLTGGIPNEHTLPSGFFIAATGVDQRGFINPQTGSGWKCDGDWGLVFEWHGARLPAGVPGGYGLSRGETRKLVEAIVTQLTIEIDGVEFEVVRTAAKWVVQPDLFGDVDQILQSIGAFIEPYSLEPGVHTATATFEVDLDCLPDLGGECDGIADLVIPLTSAFEVISD